MGIFTKKQPHEPVNRVILFVSDESTRNVCEVLYVERIVDGRIITENADLVLPLDDATIYNTADGLVYAFHMNLPYLKEIQHLAEVEKNIIIEQAFLYPGRMNGDASKNNLMTFVIVGVLGLITLVSLFT